MTVKRFISFYISLTIFSLTAFAEDYNGYLQMLADFTPYIYNSYLELDTTNSIGEPLATFKGENTQGDNEQGVRHNADLSMVSAFLCKYARGEVKLPKGISWKNLEQMAMRTLVYAYSTHKANRLYPCKNGRYWGSVSNRNHSWESSLWTMSVAYSAFFQWNKLSAEQRQYVYQMLRAECHYELERTIPTGFAGDTKAEENGWECNVLAVTLALFPDDPLAPKWFERLREFAINSYSHSSDRYDHTVIDPDYDRKTVADLYRGANLYDDYTLQNHNYFHTSYQNVVIQELGEAALALKLIQTELHRKERWHTNALMHNCEKVEREVLNWLALPDGELAMPNGNDWSLFLYDQLTSYSTMACFLRDADALMLEQSAATQIRNRQKTTTDGSWLLRPDVGARRMGVEAHRVMMAWLMHHAVPTNGMTASTWTDFARRHRGMKMLKDQDVVRVLTDRYFACFSWSKGLRSNTGYFAPILPANNNMIVPFRQGGTGNLLGWYEVEGCKTNALDVEHRIDSVGSGIVGNGFRIETGRGREYVISGRLLLNDSSLMQYYSIRYLRDRIILRDSVVAMKDVSVKSNVFGTLAVSVDPFTRLQRTLDYGVAFGHTQSSGEPLLRMKTDALTVDSVLTIRSSQADVMAFGTVRNVNSVRTTLLHPAYNTEPRTFRRGELVDKHTIEYIIKSEETRR